MAIEIRREGPGILWIGLTGKLTAEDYEVFVPEVEKAIAESGPVRMVLDMHDFHGWSMAAMWEDTKFAARHFADIERLAMVGEKAWQHGMAAFCKPFTSAKVRYFDRTEAAAAKEWIEGE